MTHMSNLLLTTALDSHYLFEASTLSLSKLDHLCMLGSTVYLFILKEEKKAKLAE